MKKAIFYTLLFILFIRFTMYSIWESKNNNTNCLLKNSKEIEEWINKCITISKYPTSWYECSTKIKQLYCN